MHRTSVLFIGHDLKFLSHIINHFNAKDDYRIDVHSFTGHHFDEPEKILYDLARYDILFCEWGLGNLKWFSQNKLPGQKLITRIHAQEFTTSFLSETSWDNVDKIIFVGPYMKEKFIGLFPDCEAKCMVIPNLVDTDSFDRDKKDDAIFHLGLLGILPKLKAPHLALDLLAELRKTDDRYRLFIKSKRPEELNWLWRNQEEQAYYTNFFSSIDRMGLQDAVIFEPHDSEVGEWFRNIGFIISPSDYESFHMAVAEGMASGSIPVIRNWEGSGALFPERLIFRNIQEAAALIVKYSNLLTFKEESEKLKQYCISHFSLGVLLPEYDQIMTIQTDEDKINEEYYKLLVLRKTLATELIASEKEIEKAHEDLEQYQLLITKYGDLMKEVQQLKREIFSYHRLNAKLIQDLGDLKKDLKETKRLLAVIQNSLSWKVGSALIRKPVSIYRRFLK
jgi:glycosyltransferase involved in cell wall biosynthesis